MRPCSQCRRNRQQSQFDSREICPLPHPTPVVFVSHKKGYHIFGVTKTVLMPPADFRSALTGRRADRKWRPLGVWAVLCLLAADFRSALTRRRADRKWKPLGVWAVLCLLAADFRSALTGRRADRKWKPLGAWAVLCLLSFRSALRGRRGDRKWRPLGVRAVLCLLGAEVGSIDQRTQRDIVSSVVHVLVARSQLHEVLVQDVQHRYGVAVSKVAPHLPRCGMSMTWTTWHEAITGKGGWHDTGDNR